MADIDRGGTVVVVKPHYRSWALCTCGWMAKPRVLLSSATVEALLHAARHGCEPAVPLIQPGVMTITERRGILDVDCRQGAGGQPPHVDQRRAPLRAPGRLSSSNCRDCAVPQFTPSVLQLIDAHVTGDFLQLTGTDSRATQLLVEHDGEFTSGALHV
jgi:hypothetical protein